MNNRILQSIAIIIIATQLMSCDSTISSWIDVSRSTRPDKSIPENSLPPSNNSPALGSVPDYPLDISSSKIFSNQTLLGSGSGNAKFTPDGTKILTWVRQPTITDDWKALILDQDGLNPQLLELPVRVNSMGSSTSTFTPNGQAFVFSTGKEIYYVRTDGSQFKKLTQPFVTGGTVDNFTILPNSSRIVFLASAEISGVKELYSVNIDGSNLTKLSDNAIATGGLTTSGTQGYQVTVDGTRILYRWRYSSAFPYELYSVLASGGSTLKINNNLPAGRSVRNYILSPNSAYVAYTADESTLNLVELFVSPVGASTPTKVSGALIAAGDVYSNDSVMTFTPDSTKVIYTADDSVDEVYNIFSVNLDGTGLTQLNSAVAGTRDAQASTFDAGDGKIYYLSDVSADNVYSLFSVNPDGTNRTLLVSNFATYPGYANLPWTPPANMIWKTSVAGVLVMLLNDGLFYRVNMDGSGATLLTPSVAGEVFIGLKMNTTGTGFYYQSSSNPGGQFRKIYYINIDGTGNSNVFASFPTESQLTSVSSVSATGRVLVNSPIRTVLIHPSTFSKTDILGASPSFISQYVSADTAVHLMTSDNQKVVSRQLLSDGSSFGIFAANASDGSNRTLLSPTVPTAPPIVSFWLAPDNQTVHILTSPDPVFGSIEIYRVNLDGTGWTKTSRGGPDIRNFYDFRYSAVGGYMVYEARQDHAFLNELYAAKNDGTGFVKLNQNLFSNGDVREWKISPTSTKVVYVAQQTTLNVSDLYTVNLDGSGNTKINPALPSGGNVEGLTYSSNIDISPNGSKIIYIADQVTDEVYELFAVNWDGSGFLKLNSALTSGGDVYLHRITPNSQSVVFSASLDSSSMIELYKVNIDGSGQTKLSGTLVSGGNVGEFQISNDSQYVVFRADKVTDTIDEIFSTKLNGSAAVKLNRNIVAGGSIRTFQITSDSQRVIYTADAEIAGLVEIYSVKMDGTDHRKLNRLLISGEGVESFKTKGNSVVFNLKRGGVFELYQCNTSGTQFYRLHSNLTPLQSVGQVFSFSPDGSLLYFDLNDEDYRKSSTYFVPNL